MNLLFVLYIGFDRHGPSVHLLKNIIEECLKKGHDVRMIVRNRGGSDPDIPAELEKYPNLHCDVIHDTQLEKGAFVKRYIEDVRYAYRCRNIYKKYRDTDAVFLQSNTTPLFALRLLKRTINAPVLFNVQNVFPIDAGVLHKLPVGGIKGIPYAILRKMQQRAYRMADRIVTVSEDMKKTLMEEGVPEKKLELVYNWSYSDEAIRIPDEKNLFLRDHPELRKKFRVVFAGNLGAMVDPAIFAEAAARLRKYPDIQFIIIGDGNNMKKLQSMAEENELRNMTFFPYQPEEYARHNYAMANVNINALPPEIIRTCMPSKTAPMLNSGRPIVTAVDTDSYYAGILREAGCAVVDQRDIDGFTEAIGNIYLSGQGGSSEDARRVFLKYCSCGNAARYEQILSGMKR